MTSIAAQGSAAMSATRPTSVLASGPQDTSAAAPSIASPDVFRQVGEMARQLHDTMTRLSVLPRLSELTGDLPDARSRLSYIASKTGAAAETVLNLVDTAKLEKARIAEATRAMAQAIVDDPVSVVASGGLIEFVRDVEASTSRLDAHLTSMMLAQDFHDLTGQVVNKVVGLAAEMEAQLVQLLIRSEPVAPSAAASLQVAEASKGSHGTPPERELQGPVVDHAGRTDVVASQEQVDDLLASLGF